MTEWPPRPSLISGTQQTNGNTHNMKATRSLSTALLGLTLAAGTVATALAANINRKDFSRTIDNPFFPLVSNTTFVYVGTKDGIPERDEFKVTDQTKDIL